MIVPAPPGKTLGDDVRAAIGGEYERSARYAGMARTARDEGFNEIADWFELLAKVQRSRIQRLQRALDALDEQSWIGFGR